VDAILAAGSLHMRQD
jgi:integrase